MPPPPSIPGARTHRAERIAKEAANPLSSEKSATESITESSTDDEKGGHVKLNNLMILKMLLVLGMPAKMNMLKLVNP